eukprot:TRINITY_DN22157_c0_g1_i1.p1 TRINITY_DN22157_c0_g1~~TRINITY_DN22157_c0_g1_i1.p1  ORF type:complete len:626 (-),score=36.07 TRINITY_DN22157_c0_g1_i1:91-1968(-)
MGSSDWAQGLQVWTWDYTLDDIYVHGHSDTSSDLRMVLVPLDCRSTNFTLDRFTRCARERIRDIIEDKTGDPYGRCNDLPFTIVALALLPTTDSAPEFLCNLESAFLHSLFAVDFGEMVRSGFGTEKGRFLWCRADDWYKETETVLYNLIFDTSNTSRKTFLTFGNDGLSGFQRLPELSERSVWLHRAFIHHASGFMSDEFIRLRETLNSTLQKMTDDQVLTTTNIKRVPKSVGDPSDASHEMDQVLKSLSDSISGNTSSHMCLMAGSEAAQTFIGNDALNLDAVLAPGATSVWASAENAEAQETEVSENIVKKYVHDFYEPPPIPSDIQTLEDREYDECNPLTEDEEAKLAVYRKEQNEREEMFSKNKRPDAPLVLVLDVECNETSSEVGLAKVCAVMKGVKYTAPELPLSVIIYGENFQSFTGSVSSSTQTYNMNVLMQFLIRFTNVVVFALKSEVKHLITSRFFTSGRNILNSISTTLVGFPRLHFFTTEKNLGLPVKDGELLFTQLIACSSSNPEDENDNFESIKLPKEKFKACECERGPFVMNQLVYRALPYSPAYTGNFVESSALPISLIVPSNTIRVLLPELVTRQASGAAEEVEDVNEDLDQLCAEYAQYANMSEEE